MYTQHPLSSAFPGMTPQDFHALVEDIGEHGVREPITIHDGMILDGWHRFQACLVWGIACPERPLGDTEDPLAYVYGLNLFRRHLTASQRALAVVACEAWLGRGRPTEENGQPLSILQKPATAEQMAEKAEVSRSTIKNAKKAQSAGLGEAVRDGRVSVSRAAEIAELPEPEREAAIESPPSPREESSLKEQLAEMARLCEELRQDNESMARVFDGTDQVAQAMKEAARFREQARVLDSRVKGLTAQLHEAEASAKYWKNKYEKEAKK